MVYSRANYLKNRDKIIAHQKSYYEEHKEAVRFHRSEYAKMYISRLSDEQKEMRKNYMREYRIKNPGRFNPKAREFQANRRMKLIRLLGGKCSNPDCLVTGGCTDTRCLQFDHVNGHGIKNRKQNGGYNGMISYYLKYPNMAKGVLQLLCANCNWIKKHENGENPNMK